jgi:hypothetical protein
MTPKQHAAKWRTIARLEDGPRQIGLCYRVSEITTMTEWLEMRAALQHMQPARRAFGFWWAKRYGDGVEPYGYDENPDNRVLAALFLAAMVEAGDA